MSRDDFISPLLTKCSEALEPLGDSDEAWKAAIELAIDSYRGFCKRALETKSIVPPAAQANDNYSRLLEHAGRVAQLWQGDIAGIPNRPGPLSSMLVLGLLGAGTGYGASRLWGRATGHDNPRRDKALAALGGMTGTLPGWGYAALNFAGDPQGKQKVVGAWQQGDFGRLLGIGGDALTGTILDTPRLGSPADKASAALPRVKFATAIPVDRVKEMVFEDPWVANRLPISLRAATAGLVEGAQHVPGRDHSLPLVTPHDIGRMAVGLGSGYLSGLLVGKALGGLFGVSDRSQQLLRRSGAAAGLIRSVVPMAFGQ